MDLSKAFDCLPHDLLTAKLQAYGVTKDTLKLILSYLSQRKQCIKNGGSLSLLKIIVSGAPQGSILGLILLIFLNDIFLILGQDLHNFADDNTITAIAKTSDSLVHDLETKSESETEWTQRFVEKQLDNSMLSNAQALTFLLSLERVLLTPSFFQTLIIAL